MFKKNKFFVLAFVAAIFLTLFFVVTQIPSANPVPKNIPIAVVNLDQGKMGKTIFSKITGAKKSTNKNTPTVEWTYKKDEDSARKGMNQQKYYATIVVPKNFTKDIAGVLQNKSDGTQLKIIINQGVNPTLAGSVSTLLTTMVGKINGEVQAQMFKQLAIAQIKLPAETSAKMMNIVTAKTETVHSTKHLMTASSGFFQPIWIASLVSALMLFYAGKGREFKSRKHLAWFKLGQVSIAALLAITMGFLTTLYSEWILGYNLPTPVTVGWFLSIAGFAFIMLILGFVSWLGVPGVAIFGILLFFSAPLMQLAPQMIPHFYRVWVTPWLPMRFLFDGSRGILYYGQHLWNNSVSGLLIVMSVGLVVIFSEIFSPRRTFVNGELDD